MEGRGGTVEGWHYEREHRVWRGERREYGGGTVYGGENNVWNGA